MTTVFVCPKCGIWMSQPGWCLLHPHVGLAPQDASALTGPARDSHDAFMGVYDGMTCSPDEACPTCGGAKRIGELRHGLVQQLPCFGCNGTGIDEGTPNADA